MGKQKLIKRFIKYVKISSPSGKEQAFASLLKRDLHALGIKPHEDSFGNIYADIKGDDKESKPILLNAHMDTVGHDKKIDPRIKNGIITSDGTTILGADNKAGIAVIMETLHQLKERKLKHQDIQILFTVSEEIGLIGARNINRKWIRAKSGFVLDGGDVNIIYNRAPSQINISAEIIGRAAHAGVHPEKGINAIQVASCAISQMPLGRIDFETTANIGIIEGGKATNIVPDRVFIKGEARSHDKLKLKTQISKMANALKIACKKYRAKLNLKIEKMYYSFNIDKNDKLIKTAKKALLGIGLKPKIESTGGGSDANIFNKLGIKTIIIGVGADNVHTSKERIKVKDMENGVRYLLEAVALNA